MASQYLFSLVLSDRVNTKRKCNTEYHICSVLIHLQVGFPGWPPKPTEPTLESSKNVAAAANIGSAPPSSSVSSGYEAAAISGYVATSASGYGHAREDKAPKEAKSSGSPSTGAKHGESSGKGELTTITRLISYSSNNLD